MEPGQTLTGTSLAEQSSKADQLGSGEASASPDTVNPSKIDEITALQDAIDGLSLSMFEALRGLRDAVAPESGNLGGNNAGKDDGNESGEPDFDEFWQSYRQGDEETVSMVMKASGGVVPQKREDFIRIHKILDREKDAELVARLANTILEKSSDIDDRVSSLSGMNRTKSEQLARIEELVSRNNEAIEELTAKYGLAKQKQGQIRSLISSNTSKALGISQAL